MEENELSNTDRIKQNDVEAAPKSCDNVSKGDLI